MRKSVDFRMPRCFAYSASFWSVDLSRPVMQLIAGGAATTSKFTSGMRAGAVTRPIVSALEGCYNGGTLISLFLYGIRAAYPTIIPS